MKMRSLAIAVLLMSCSLCGFAQLSRSETINYLSARLAESQDLSLHYNSELTYKISATKCYENPKYPGKFCFSYDRAFSSGVKDHLEYIFDPTHVVGIKPNAENLDDGVGLLVIDLIGKTLILKQNSNVMNSDKFVFPYLRAEKLNIERVQKALLHLQKLYQDAKPLDPFVN
jgi:hypothetical protein